MKRPRSLRRKAAHSSACAVEVACGRIPVIAGAGSNSTAHAIVLTRHSEACEADAVLSVVPYYNKPTQVGLLRAFSGGRAIVRTCQSSSTMFHREPPVALPTKRSPAWPRCPIHRLEGRDRRYHQAGALEVGRGAGFQAPFG